MGRQERIDLIVGEHAARLSERMQAHRARLFPPDARRSLRKFTSGEAARLLGVKDAYLRKLHPEGKRPAPEQGAKPPGTYLSGRRGRKGQ